MTHGRQPASLFEPGRILSTWVGNVRTIAVEADDAHVAHAHALRRFVTLRAELSEQLDVANQLLLVALDLREEVLLAALAMLLALAQATLQDA